MKSISMLGAFHFFTNDRMGLLIMTKEVQKVVSVNREVVFFLKNLPDVAVPLSFTEKLYNFKFQVFVGSWHFEC